MSSSVEIENKLIWFSIFNLWTFG